MFRKITHVIPVLLALTLLGGLTTPAFAAPLHQGACGQDYNIQADDWLSKLADKFFGDVQAFVAIVDATNSAAQADSSYATIENPDLVEVGWKVCIPESAMGMMMDGAMMDGAMMAPVDPGETVNFNVRIENIADFANKASGVFNTPAAASEPGPLLPGGAYEFAFTAAPGDSLSFASMFVQSNDLFIGPGQAGIALFNADGSPVTGDITDQIQLWDAGTEINQEPGVGADQALNQSSANTGAVDPDNTVRLASNTFNNLPAVSEVIQVTLASTSANGFVLRIDNITDGPTLSTSAGKVPTPFAPGVWVVHSGDNPLFAVGNPDAGLGLEALAEDGNPAGLAAALAAQSGTTTPLAPGVWVVHTIVDPLFTAGQADRGLGLEALAEDGNPADLAAALAGQNNLSSSGAFNTPLGESAPGALLPGNAYEFSIQATPGDYLSFATMFVQSNDLFYAPGGHGIALFDANNAPISGSVTDQVQLWDAGTEVNQAPGLGSAQAPRQAGPSSGDSENGVVQVVADGFSYTDTTNSIVVTISVEK